MRVIITDDDDKSKKQPLIIKNDEYQEVPTDIKAYLVKKNV